MNLWLLQNACVRRRLNLRKFTLQIKVNIVRIFAQYGFFLGNLGWYFVKLDRVNSLLKVFLIHLQLFCVFPGYETFALTKT